MGFVNIYSELFDLCFLFENRSVAVAS